MDPEPIKSVLGSKSRVLSDIRRAREISINAGKQEVRPFQRKQARAIAVFTDKYHKEIWEFCIANHVNLSDYEKDYIDITDHTMDPRYLNQPEAIELTSSGNLAVPNIQRYFRVEETDNGKKVKCQLCFGSGFCLGITGIICYQGHPQELINIPCFCQR